MFQKGQQKTGGRTKGTLNKSKLFLSVILENDTLDWKEDFSKAIANLDSADKDIAYKALVKANFYKEILQYLVTVPKTAEIPIIVKDSEESVTNANQLFEEAKQKVMTEASTKSKEEPKKEEGK